jgi:hypothetical protein
MPEPGHIVDAEFQLVGASHQQPQGAGFGLGHAYLVTGGVLGGLTRIVVFLGGWFYCLSWWRNTLLRLS